MGLGIITWSIRNRPEGCDGWSMLDYKGLANMVETMPVVRPTVGKDNWQSWQAVAGKGGGLLERGLNLSEWGHGSENGGKLKIPHDFRKLF